MHPILSSCVAIVLLPLWSVAQSGQVGRPSWEQEAKRGAQLLTDGAESEKGKDFHTALNKFQEAATVFETLKYNEGLYAAFQHIGTLFLMTERIKDAKLALESSLKFAKEVEHPLTKARFTIDALCFLSLAGIAEGQFTEAEARTFQAATIARKNSLNTLAQANLFEDWGEVLFDKKGELWKYIASLRESTIIAPPDVRAVATFDYRRRLAMFHLDLGEYEQAREQAQIAAETMRHLSPSEKNINFVSALSVLGDAWAKLGKDNEALAAYQEALNAFSASPESRQGELDLNDKVILQRIYAGLAEVYIRSNKLDAAQKILEAASRYTSELGDILFMAVAKGDLEYARGNFGRAQQEYEKTINKKVMDVLLRTSAFTVETCGQTDEIADGFHIEDQIYFHASLGRTLANLQKHELALCEEAKAVSLLEQLRVSLDDLSLKRSAFNSKFNIYQDIVELLFELHQYKEQLNSASVRQFGQDARTISLHYSEAAHARTFAERLGPTIAQHYVPTSETSSDLVRNVKDKAARLKRFVELDRIPGTEDASLTVKDRRQQIEKMEKDLDSAVEQLKKADSVLGSMLYPQPAAWKDIAPLLGNDNLIEYFVASNATYCWVADARGVGEFFKFDVSQADLTHSIEKLREQLGPLATRSPDDLLLRNLYTLLLDKPLTWIQQNSPHRNGATTSPVRLVIVPDNELYLLPFEVLLRGDGQSVGNVFITSYYPSATAMVQLSGTRGRSNWSADILLVGDSIARPGDTVNVPGVGTFGYLSSAHEELKDLAQLFGARDQCSEVLTGSCAEKTLLLKRSSQNELTNYRYIHFSTHAFAYSIYPEPSLVLYATTSRPEDALLSMSEIPLLKLRADLVSLSACQTGLGEEQPTPAEGIVGLSQSFFYAGARSILASLWEVEGKATHQFMLSFYRELRKNPDKAAALFSARKALKASTTGNADISSGFILIGEPR